MRPNLISRDSSPRQEIAGRLAEIGSAAARRVLTDCLAGEISPNIAIARLLMETGRAAAAEKLVDSAAGLWGEPLPGALAEMVRMVREHREGCERAASILARHPDAAEVASPEEVIAANRSFFDSAVRESEEASVAAYSLGSPGLLAAVTGEIVSLFETWGLLGGDREALEIGCGIGRMQAALAPHLGEVHGIDISGEMIAVARRRCAGLANVHLSVSSGQDLARYSAERFDLIFAVDSFPYIYQAGPEIVEEHFYEVARVLRPGGDFALLNFSYRDDLAADQEEVEELCEEADLLLEVPGIEPFELWDGMVFLCRKPR